MTRKKTTLLVFVLLAVAAGLFYRGDWQRAGSGMAGPPPSAVVRVATAQRQDLADRLEALGTTRANEAVVITADVTGKVKAIHFEDDQWVADGQLLVELDAGLEQARLREAEVNLKEEERLLDHYRTLVSSQAVSRTLLDEQHNRVLASRARLEAATAELADFTIRAPFAGMLGARRVSPGGLVSPGTLITTLDAVDSLRVDFTVPERWLSRVRPGQVIRAGSVAWPGRQFTGDVVSVGSRVDAVTRAAQVRARVDNGERLLRPGMLLTLTLLTEPRPALTVPEMAVIKSASDNFVFVVDADDRVERRPVTLGARHQGRVEIAEGLEAGERVVTEGTQKVAPGASVTVAGTPAPVPEG